MESLEERLRKLERRNRKQFASIDKHFANIDEQFTAIDKHFVMVEAKLSLINDGVKNLRSEFQALDQQQEEIFGIVGELLEKQRLDYGKLDKRITALENK